MANLLTVAKQTFLGQQVRNTFYWSGADATLANAQALVDAIRVSWTSIQAAHLSDTWQLDSFDVFNKDVASLPGQEYFMTSGVLLGGSSNDPLPTQLALLLAFKASTVVPNSNRKYLAGFMETHTTDGLFVVGAVNAASAFGNSLLSMGVTLSKDIALSAVTLAVDGTVSDSNPLSQAIGRSIPATQRRRRMTVGI